VDYAPGFYLVETDEIGGALNLAEQLREQPGVLGADPVLARLRQKKWVPNDTLFSQQWHLQNAGQGGGTAGIDVNITDVWDTYRGSNILIGIVDDGLQLTHTDLFQNVNTTLDWDWNDGDGDPSPVLSNDWHGTSCAGVAAARGHNGRGVSGAAPYATLVGYRLIGGEATDVMEASAMTTNNHLVHLKSNSWGPYDDGVLEGPGPLTRAALSNAATTGRGGRGTILVWAGGNGLEEYDDSNYDGYANSIYTIAVAGLTDSGKQAWYSEPGANLVVTAPSSGGSTDIITTDLLAVFYDRRELAF
jgi:subtilisin family serine protease